MRKFLLMGLMTLTVVAVSACADYSANDRADGKTVYSDSHAARKGQAPTPGKAVRIIPGSLSTGPMMTTTTMRHQTTPPALPQFDLKTGKTRIPRKTASPETVRIGILLPLTGSNAAIGKALLDAAQMALFELGEKNAQLIPRDTQGTPDGARNAAISALSEGCEILIGPVFAGSVAAVKPVASALNINVIAFTTDWTQGGDNVFVFGFTPFDQIRRVTEYALSKGYDRFAAAVPNTPYGAAVMRSLEAAATPWGGSLVQVETFEPTGTDWADLAKKLADYDNRRAALEQLEGQLEAFGDEGSKAALEQLGLLETIGKLPYDALVLPEGGDRLKRLAPELHYYDIDPKKIRLLGSGQWDDPSLAGEPVLEGA
ncbi:MAG: penicillin-binding protein activator, partial [Pseudomonadota bacterium]|nr:penicillin-binding protein activator [Pseudomonadota bacterium]